VDTAVADIPVEDIIAAADKVVEDMVAVDKVAVDMAAEDTVAVHTVAVDTAAVDMADWVDSMDNLAVVLVAADKALVQMNKVEADLKLNNRLNEVTKLMKTSSLTVRSCHKYFWCFKRITS
jgi:hypothetical protein